MAFTIIDTSGPIISATISGELGKSEVTQIQAAAVDAMRRFGKISALFVLDNFRGWKREPDWGDVTFMTEHDKEITKIAVVGGGQWRDLVVTVLATRFRQTEVVSF